VPQQLAHLGEFTVAADQLIPRQGSALAEAVRMQARVLLQDAQVHVPQPPARIDSQLLGQT
jgi:hypothetical protein